ncbi:MAG: hypothetical protein ACI4D2_05750 [Lachnospiraceae bacterium]
MNTFTEINELELTSIDGGCTWYRVGATLMTVGGVEASGCDPVAVTLAAPSLIVTWAC